MPVPAIPEAPVPITIPENLELDHARALFLLCELNRKRAGKDNPLGLVDFRAWVDAFYERYGLNGWSHCSDLIYKFQLAHGAPRLPEGNSFRPAPAIAIEPELALRALHKVERELEMVLTPVPAWFDPNYVERPRLALEEGAVINTPAGPARLVRQADGSILAVPVNPPAKVPPAATTLPPATTPPPSSSGTDEYGIPMSPTILRDPATGFDYDGHTGARMDPAEQKGEDRREDADSKRSGKADTKATRRS